MEFQLGNWVVAGELINTRQNAVHGWLEVHGRDTPVLLQLSGNLSPDLAGRRLRFEARHHLDAALPDAEAIDQIAWQQIGPTGEMTAVRRVRAASCSPLEARRHDQLGEPLPLVWKPTLYLEWFSQNGPVVVELVDPIIEFIDEDALNDPSDDLLDESETELASDWDAEHSDEFLFGDDFDGAEEEEEDPFGLLPPGLNDELERQARQTDRAIHGDPDIEDDSAETLAEMQLLDDLMQHGEEVPVGDVFDTLVRLPKADALTEGEAEQVLKSLLARLALQGIAFDICEHYSMREAYRLLVDTICREEGVFPELIETRWVQHFSTHEYCSKCLPELEDPPSDEDSTDSPNPDADQ